MDFEDLKGSLPGHVYQYLVSSFLFGMLWSFSRSYPLRCVFVYGICCIGDWRLVLVSMLALTFNFVWCLWLMVSQPCFYQMPWWTYVPPEQGFQSSHAWSTMLFSYFVFYFKETHHMKKIFNLHFYFALFLVGCSNSQTKKLILALVRLLLLSKGTENPASVLPEGQEKSEKTVICRRRQDNDGC